MKLDWANPSCLAALLCALPGELVLDVAADAVLGLDAGRGDGHGARGPPGRRREGQDARAHSEQACVAWGPPAVGFSLMLRRDVPPSSPRLTCDCSQTVGCPQRGPSDLRSPRPFRVLSAPPSDPAPLPALSRRLPLPTARAGASLRHAMNSSLALARRAALRARAAPRLRHYVAPAATQAPAPTSPAPMTTTMPPDDDPQLADYPRLPFVSKQTRPARGWEDMQFRRNFGETVR